MTFATAGANIALKTDANGYIITDNWIRTGNNTGFYTADGSYKADSTNITHIGFIADEVPDEMASPERKGVDQANTVALLVKVLQEISEKVDALQNKVQVLQQKVDQYEKK